LERRALFDVSQQHAQDLAAELVALPEGSLLRMMVAEWDWSLIDFPYYVPYNARNRSRKGKAYEIEIDAVSLFVLIRSHLRVMETRSSSTFCTHIWSCLSGMRKRPGPRFCSRGSRQSLPVRVALGLTVVFGCSGWAFAGFNSSWLETFDGTSVDSSTWRLTNPQWVSQNSAASINMSGSTNPAVPTQFTSSGIALGVSSSAKIQVTFTGHGPSNFTQIAYLSLTSADSGQGWYLFDSYAVEAQLGLGPYDDAFMAGYYHGGGGDAGGHVYSTALNTLYSIQLERLSDTSVRYTLYDSANTIIQQYLRTLPSYTGPLYIAFGADSIDATFDNLQLTGTIVPEPSASALLGTSVGLLILRHRTRREGRRQLRLRMNATKRE
jgi:hypothetical protein